MLPDETIQGPYTECFHNKNSNSNSITLDELSLQINDKQLDKYDKVIILGGKCYTDIIKELFEAKEVYNPLEECKGIGYMMKKLNELIQ